MNTEKWTASRVLVIKYDRDGRYHERLFRRTVLNNAFSVYINPAGDRFEKTLLTTYPKAYPIPDDAQPLLEDTKFVMCLALVCGFGLLLTLNPGLLVLPKDTTFTEQVARQAGLEALSCPTILDSKYMPGQGRYECEYVDAKGKAHDMSLLVASGDKVWLYDHNGKPMKVEKK